MSSVLVVDDDPEMRAYIADCVTRLGHDVIVANDGVAGLEMIETVKIDLVITDISMPRKNGIELILDLAKRASKIPVIVATGSAMSKSVETAAWLHGAVTILRKPFRPEQLETAMQARLWDQRRSGAE